MSQGTNLRDYLAAQPPDFQSEVAQRAERRIRHIADGQFLQALIDSGQSSNKSEPQPIFHVSARSERRAGRALRALQEFAAEVGGELQIAIRFPDSPTPRVVASTTMDATVLPFEPVVGVEHE